MFKDDVAEIRVGNTGAACTDESKGGVPLMTVMQAIKRGVDRHGDKPAMAVERPLPPLEGKSAPDSAPLSQWKTWTWKQYYSDTRSAAKGMMKLGAVQFDGVNILGFNSPEWFMAELAAMFLGGKAAGIYPTDTCEQIQFKTALSDGSVAVVDNKAAFEKYQSIVDELPYLKAIVAWEYPEVADIKRKDGSVVKCMTWDQLVELGAKEDDEALEKVMEATKPGNCGALVFTSGTTGHPKAVMLSHDNILFEAYVVGISSLKMYGEKLEQERILSYLPLSHVAGMMVDIVTPILVTAFKTGWVTTYFARPYDLKAGTIGKRLLAVRPTLFLGVPRVWEKIAEKMKAVGAAMPDGLKKNISTWAKGIMLEHQKNCLVGGTGETPWGFTVASKLLFKAKEALGLDQCKFHVSGAAPMARDTLEYFGSIGININECYGMSECAGACTWSEDQCHLWGSIGREISGVEVKILIPNEDGEPQESELAVDPFAPTEAQQGEVCFRGRNNMMGYLANPLLGEEHVAEIKKKNEEALDAHGFLHSGDKGSKDLKGMFRITGRYKELIITAGGENIAPVPIEDTIKSTCPMVSNAMMIGDKRKFNVVLITLKSVGATGEKPGSDELEPSVLPFVTEGVTTISQAMNDEKLIKFITEGIKKTNADGNCCPSNASKIQKFTILPLDFSVETEELTPSLKLKRSVAEQKYSEAIDKLYESKDLYMPFP